MSHPTSPGAGAVDAADASRLMPDLELPPLSGDGAFPLPSLEIPPLSGVGGLPRPSAGTAPCQGAKCPGRADDDSSLDENPFSLELDTILSLQEGVGNSLRFLFSPLVRGKNFTEVVLSVSSEDIQTKSKKRNFVSSSEPYEFVFGVRGLESGVYVCEVSLSYVLDGRRFSYEGPLEVVVQSRKDHQAAAARSLAILTSPGVDKLMNASSKMRVTLPEYARIVLKKEIESGRDPLEMVEELVNLGTRQYRKLRMFRRDMVDVLEKPPQEAVCKEIQPRNASSGISVTPFPIVAVISEVLFLKAPAPIVRTLSRRTRWLAIPPVKTEAVPFPTAVTYFTTYFSSTYLPIYIGITRVSTLSVNLFTVTVAAV